MEIKPWDDYFLDLAKTCASRSNCLRAQVGAVIVGEDKKIKATGYNGTPSKVESCAERGECYRIKNNIPSGTKYETCRSIHAEQNAIIQAGQDRCHPRKIRSPPPLLSSQRFLSHYPAQHDFSHYPRSVPQL